MGSSWEQPLDQQWQLVIKSARSISFPTEASAIDWFVACFEELRASGMLGAITTLGMAAPGDDVDGAPSQ